MLRVELKSCLAFLTPFSDIENMGNQDNKYGNFFEEAVKNPVPGGFRPKPTPWATPTPTPVPTPSPTPAAPKHPVPSIWKWLYYNVTGQSDKL